MAKQEPNSTPERKKVLGISSGGGHWIQLERILPALRGHDLALATVHARSSEAAPGARFYRINEATMWNKPGLLLLALRVLWILLRERPQVVLTTGAAGGYFALRFAKWVGCRTIWIDSIANADELSRAGRKAGRYADLWLTQWEHLASPDGPEFRGSVL